MEGFDSLFFVGLEAALVLGCRQGCEAIPERLAGQVLFCSPDEAKQNLGMAVRSLVFSLPDERGSLRKHGQAPVESVEHRRLKRGSRRGLFEQQAERLMRVPQPPFQARSAGNP